MCRCLLPAVVLVFSFAFASPRAFALLDELPTLKQELDAYADANRSGFLDILDRLRGIANPRFGDVHATDWFHGYVTAAAQWGIVSGYRDAAGRPTGSYGPGNPVTVAETLKMAFKAAGVDEMRCTPLVHHPQAHGHWAARFVACAEEMSMRIFQTATPPDLNRPITRAEMLTVIHDAFGDRVPLAASTLTDAAGHRYAPDIAHGVERGIVSGDRDAAGEPLGTFRPDDSLNRAEAAKILFERLRVQAEEKLAPSLEGE